MDKMNSIRFFIFCQQCRLSKSICNFHKAIPSTRPPKYQPYQPNLPKSNPVNSTLPQFSHRYVSAEINQGISTTRKLTHQAVETPLISNLFHTLLLFPWHQDNTLHMRWKLSFILHSKSASLNSTGFLYRLFSFSGLPLSTFFHPF